MDHLEQAQILFQPLRDAIRSDASDLVGVARNLVDSVDLAAHGLMVEPPLARVGTDDDAIINALLGGVVEGTARARGLPVPAWTEEPCRYLSSPVFRRAGADDETVDALLRRGIKLSCRAV